MGSLMQVFPRSWDTKMKVDFLQRKIIVNSILYYELNFSTISDSEFDSLCKQLVELQKTIDISATQYGYAFHDFDGSTGFDLYHRLTDHDKRYLYNIALLVTDKSETEQKRKKKKGGLF